MDGVILDSIAAATAGPQSRGLLRVLTCGSVDDGKSTLIGRLLHDAGAIPDDQLAALARDSRRHGTTGDDLDLALLADGLEAERQQGITIDVAYRFFSTPRRAFILADTPGHEQYTRNMATGASGSEFAIILVDARKGILTQTRRHAHICALMGIRHVALAVNKIDLVGFDQATFDRITAEFAVLADRLGFRSVLAVPVSARFGQNVSALSPDTPWYRGPALLRHLESIDTADQPSGAAFRFPVQWVNRPDGEFRGVSGTIAGGMVAVGDQVAVAPSGRITHVARIVTADGDRLQAVAGEAVTLTMRDEIDIARGDVLASADARPAVADQFAAHVLWMGEAQLQPGQNYLLRIGHVWTHATVISIRHRIDVNTMEEKPAKSLAANEIALCHLSTAQPVAIDPYAENRTTGAFILVDRHTNATAAAGMITAALRRATNIHPEHFLVDAEARAATLGQRPAILWFTGLSGAGKSTIAKLVERKLHRLGRHTYSLDGDNLRHGLNKDLGFTDADRVENIRRAGETARILLDAGLIVLCSFISPFRAERDLVRELVAPGEFFEIFVDTPLVECERRDAKGLYARARAGEIRNFTGIGSDYEAPVSPDVVLRTFGRDPEDLADELIRLLGDFGA